uniref:SEC7 domain-containing protein n=1 Tax=Arion vulgaris TaxID=1028688 RepID=A0A0B7BHF0_9EUPU
MASSTAHSPSRIPLPVKTTPTPVHIPVSGNCMKDFADGDHVPLSLSQVPVSHHKENGNIKHEKNDLLHSGQAEKGKGFETFLMTGEMIIHTNPTITQKPVMQYSELNMYKESHIPRLGQNDHKQSRHYKVAQPPHQLQALNPSPKLSSKIPSPVKNNTQQLQTSMHHQNHSATSQDMNHRIALSGQVIEFPKIYAPVAEMEELSDLSQSSCSESELGLDNDSPIVSPSLPVSSQYDIQSEHSTNIDTLKLDQTAENMSKLQPLHLGKNSIGRLDTSGSESYISGDSSFIHNGHIAYPDFADREFISSDRTLSSDGNFLSDETLTGQEGSLSANNNISNSPPYWQAETAGSGGEKYAIHSGNTDRLLVRTSKSHENYLQAGTNIALVNIDIEDNLAYSLDALAYHNSFDSSLDNVAVESLQMSRSLDNSPDKKSEKNSSVEREFIPSFINLEDSKPVKLKLTKQRDDAENLRNNEINISENVCTNVMTNTSSSHEHTSHTVSQVNSEGRSRIDSSCSLARDSSDVVNSLLHRDDADIDSLYHQPSKAVDRPSAERLAKRLFHLEGFRKSDVSRHLCKKNDFSNLVAEEYLKFFHFQEDTLDQALRKFLLRFSLYGETQERERVLAHFSRRFMESNSASFNSEDACHTLTCAIMLLNSDLHSPNVARRMTCQEFIENLAELNDGDNFSKEVLKSIYQAIKVEPIEWAVDEVTPELDETPIAEQVGPVQPPAPQALGSNPFLDVPDPSKTTEYKKGYVMRKCCMEPDRRKTPFGKRGWKMLYAVLRDMILYQYKDEHQLKKGHFVESTHNAIRIHHSLATKAMDYTKKQHVFRLQTADWAEYLFQTGDSRELQEWVDTINLVAASMSAPVLPGGVGSKTKFQRQLLPSLYTRLNLREQLVSHESRLQHLEQDLHSHRTSAPEKGAKSSVIQDYLDKEIYLEYEMRRFNTYINLLHGKLSTLPELDPSLLETTIGEYEEMGTSTAHSPPAVIISSAKSGSVMKPVQRSMSDRSASSKKATPIARRAQQN